MPPIRFKSKQDSIQQEGTIELAIQALQNKKVSSVRAAASVYDVPRSPLRDHV